MVPSLLSGLARRGPWLVLLLALLNWASSAQATHLRAGDIQAKIDTTVGAGNNPRRVFFKMVLYQKTPSSGVPDESSVTIFFGDCGAPQVIPRTSVVAVNSSTNRNTYLFEHTYNATGTYTVHYIGENRNAGVLNMSASSAQTFYISTTFTIDPGLGQNRSAVLTKPAIDDAAVQQVFVHNPAAYDADGDSLAYELIQSRQVSGGINGPQPPCYDLSPASGLVNPVPGYVLPNQIGNGTQVFYPGPPVVPGGGAATFSMDAVTGTLLWNSPATVGEYNIAFKVKEYRRTAFGRRLVGEVVRDMQINVRPTTNRRPVLTIPPDICVVAGTLITGNVTATDPDNNPIRLTANSGILPPATFVQTSQGPPTASGTFRWTPDCSNIAALPTGVSFTAEDQPGGGNPTPLIDQRIWNITVIGPAPQNLRVAAGNTGVRSAVLTWNSYLCRKAGARILIFRKEGPATNFNPGPCDTGIPASAGYTQIGALTYPTPLGTNDLLSFVDNGGGQGLDRGKQYCYRIYVEFPLPAGGKSLASAEACINFEGRPLLMRNVTVDRTSATNGQITVRWTRPKSTPDFADPRQYRIARAVGQTTTGPFTTIATINNVADTTYVDNDPALDTQNRSYSYRVEFLSQNLVAETATAASSVRVDGTAIPATGATGLNGISLRWTYNVPWNNALRPTTIYRRGPNATDPFVAIATVTGTAAGGTYLDEGTAAQRLVKGQTYCYYVSTNGTYGVANQPTDLINLSQQQCIALRNVPCAPVLTLNRTNCDSLASRLFDLPATPISGAVYTNRLSWTLGTTPADCSRAIASYSLYYAPAGEDSLRFLTSVPASQTSYLHQNLSAEGGCYAVQAVDSSGTRSARSNVACKDDCQLFLLPNIFTPNGDGKNDTFRPKVFTPLRRTRFTVFNRWGVKIHESSADPLINWNGGGTRSEGGSAPSVVEGVYFYQAEVEFADRNSTKRTYKGWVQITR